MFSLGVLPTRSESISISNGVSIGKPWLILIKTAIVIVIARVLVVAAEIVFAIFMIMNPGSDTDRKHKSENNSNSHRNHDGNATSNND